MGASLSVCEGDHCELHATRPTRRLPTDSAAEGSIPFGRVHRAWIRRLILFLDSYRERKRKARLGSKADVYRYDSIPKELRIRITQIAAESLGRSEIGEYPMDGRSVTAPLWTQLHRFLRREFATHTLGDGPIEAQVLNYIQNLDDVDDYLTALEVLCACIESTNGIVDWELERCGVQCSARAAISEINQRLRQSQVGYQFQGGRVVRVDSQLVHDIVVKPALSLLGVRNEFAAAEAEFLAAHEAYRNGKAEDALVNACKAFESAMKAIADKKKWKYPPNATANGLITTMLDNGLLPPHLVQQMPAIRATLEQGIGMIRNRHGGHGAGSVPRTVPDYVVAYGLHITASAILLLAEAAGMK